MSNQFSTVPSANIQRSSFNRSHGYKTAFDAGYLIPFFVDEVLPGDTFNLNVNLFARLATPVVPIMDNIYLDTFFFFVPTRLVWDNFEKFMGARENPDDSIDYLIPQFQPYQESTDVEGPVNNSVKSGDILDYMGIPVGVGDMPTINALPLRAYNLIWNEWFRDENLQDSIPVEKGDGPDSSHYDIVQSPDLTAHAPRYRLLKRGKRHDYFTSALPWPQKGPGVDLPISLPEYAPVGFYMDPDISSQSSTNRYLRVWDFGNGTPNPEDGLYYSRRLEINTGSPASVVVPTLNSGNNSSIYPYNFDDTSFGVPLVSKFDENTTAGATVNSLRQAFMLQQLLERDARGGTRYTEILRSHFNTVSPDFRLQRPEYLGGSSGLVNIHQVAQTGSTTDTSPQGNLAAYGVYADGHHGFVKSFVEHGYIIGLCNIRATLSYQQGIERMWNRKTRYDLYWPSLAHLGEQEILNKEIYVQRDNILGETGEKVNEEVFGYQERYAEYRYKPSLVTGVLRSNQGGYSHPPVDYWHLAQEFLELPKLNSSFIEDNPPIARALAVPSEPHFILDAWFNLNCVRPMPVHSIPGFSPHL